MRLLLKKVRFLAISVLLVPAVLTVSTSMAATVLMGQTGAGGTWNIYQWSGNTYNWADTVADVAATTDTVLGTGIQAKLPEVRTLTEYSIGLQLASAAGGQTWVGASDLTTEGTWTWESDGTAFYDATTGALNGWTDFWNAGEPNGGTTENCATMTGAGMNDLSPDTAVGYFYVFETGLTQMTASATSAPTYEMILDPHSGRYYELITDSVNFHAAKYIAESHIHNGVQGRLALINDAQESAFASVCANSTPTWIGLTDDERYGGVESTNWVWAGPDGSTPLTETGYAKWNAGEPNNSNNEDYVETSYGNGAWNDNGETRTTYALVEFGQTQEVAKGFYHRRASGTINDASKNTDALNIINGITATSAEVTGQTATYNFVDIAGAEGNAGFYGTAAFPGDDLDNGDDNYVVKSYVTLDIKEAGTYTIGGHHDDLMMLSFDRGAQEAETKMLTDWNYSPTSTAGTGTVTVTFDAPGTYNLYCLYGEKTGGADAELGIAKGNYDTSVATTEAEFRAMYTAFASHADLIGDTLNGGIATKNLRQIYTADGFTINGTANDTLNVSSSVNQGGSFGGDQTIAVGTAITASTQLVVPENAGGWWTLGVSQSQEGSLAITKDGQAVSFSQANGSSNGAAVAAGGAMTWNSPTNGTAVDQALGAVYLEPGTYDIAIDYNPNNQVMSLPKLEVVGGTFNVINATPISGVIANIWAAQDLMVDAWNNGASASSVDGYTTATYSTINFEEEGADAGHFIDDSYFPLFPSGQAASEDNTPYGVMVTADIVVDAQNAGDWSFCINSDDGFMMQIYDEGGNAVNFTGFTNVTELAEPDDSLFVYADGRGAEDSLATINLSEGTYTMALIHCDSGGGASLELSYAQGEHLEFDNDLFHLLGDDDIIEQLELFAAAGVHTEFGLAFDLLGNALNFEDQSEFTGEGAKVPGDANNDGKVDGSDVTILAGNWQAGVGNPNTQEITWEMGDFNHDGQIDGSDVTILAGNWQYGVSTAAASVPEPSALLLLLSSIATFFLFRLRK